MVPTRERNFTPPKGMCFFKGVPCWPKCQNGGQAPHSDILEHIEITGGLGGGVGLITLPEWGAGPPSWHFHHAPCTVMKIWFSEDIQCLWQSPQLRTNADQVRKASKILCCKHCIFDNAILKWCLRQVLQTGDKVLLMAQLNQWSSCCCFVWQSRFIIWCTRSVWGNALKNL